MLIGGLIVLIGADLALAMLPGVVAAFIGIALWGVHMAVTQGLFAKLVADRSPTELRGSAYGIFTSSPALRFWSPVSSPGLCGIRMAQQRPF